MNRKTELMTQLFPCGYVTVYWSIYFRAPTPSETLATGLVDCIWQGRSLMSTACCGISPGNSPTPSLTSSSSSSTCEGGGEERRDRNGHSFTTPCQSDSEQGGGGGGGRRWNVITEVQRWQMSLSDEIPSEKEDAAAIWGARSAHKDKTSAVVIFYKKQNLVGYATE